MSETSAINHARQEEFVEKVVEQISGTMTTLLAAIGDRLGLFKNLAEHGPATSSELASRIKLNERYLREWLGGMATAGYLNYDGPTKRFTCRSNTPQCLRRRTAHFLSAAYIRCCLRSRSVRQGCKCVSQWRGRFSIAIQRHDVGRTGAIYVHMV